MERTCRHRARPHQAPRQHPVTARPRWRAAADRPELRCCHSYREATARRSRAPWRQPKARPRRPWDTWQGQRRAPSTGLPCPPLASLPCVRRAGHVEWKIEEDPRRPHRRRRSGARERERAERRSAATHECCLLSGHGASSAVCAHHVLDWGGCHRDGSGRSGPAPCILCKSLDLARERVARGGRWKRRSRGQARRPCHVATTLRRSTLRTIGPPAATRRRGIELEELQLSAGGG